MSIGIIAGYGDLAGNVIKQCKKMHCDYHILAYKGHTNPDLLKGASYTWLELGQIGKSIDVLQKYGVRKIVLIGYFNRPSWSDLRPDIKGMQLLSKIIGKPFGDDGMFRIIANFLEQEGFQVISPEEILGQDILIEQSCLTKTTPSKQSLIDINRGLEVAKVIGNLDIGQSVVVQQGLVLGVEAIDGSDALIRRAGKLQKSGTKATFVKVIKPNQDTRIDRSVIGPDTIANIAQSGLCGIAVEANKVIIIDKAKVIDQANKLKIFVIGV